MIFSRRRKRQISCDRGLPNAPTSLYTSAASDTSIDLAWTDNSSDETSFRIERSSSIGGPYVQIDSLPPGTTTYTDTGLSPYTPYYYRVRVERNGDFSGYSNISGTYTFDANAWAYLVFSETQNDESERTIAQIVFPAAQEFGLWLKMRVWMLMSPYSYGAALTDAKRLISTDTPGDFPEFTYNGFKFDSGMGKPYIDTFYAPLDDEPAVTPASFAMIARVSTDGLGFGTYFGVRDTAPRRYSCDEIAGPQQIGYIEDDSSYISGVPGLTNDPTLNFIGCPNPASMMTEATVGGPGDNFYGGSYLPDEFAEGNIYIGSINNQGSPDNTFNGTVSGFAVFDGFDGSDFSNFKQLSAIYNDFYGR